MELQDFKSNFKLDVIRKLSEYLSDYNNINGYNNQKKFTFLITTKEARDNDKKVYSIELLRGTVNKKTIFKLNVLLDKEDYKTLQDFILKATESDNFMYTSFTNDNGSIKSYNINLMNGVSISYNIDNEHDLSICKDIESTFKNKKLIQKEEILSDTNKDEIQKTKAIKIIDAFKNLFMLITEYNAKENYTNIKPFTFNITNYFNNEKKCYVYNFEIIRGTYNKDKILDLRASIYDKEFMLNELNELILFIKDIDTYVIDSTTNGDLYDSYNLRCQNNINVNFYIKDEIDREFYESKKDKNQEKTIIYKK